METNLLITILVITVILSPFGFWGFGILVKKLKTFHLRRKSVSQKREHIFQELTTTINVLKKLNKGAMFIFTNDELIEKYIVDYEKLESNFSSNLLISIFGSYSSPLHDGAVIISDTKITHVSAYISKLSSQKLPKDFGTRHRSALGITEVTDSFVITLSEESGKITIFKSGNYKISSTKDLLVQLLNWNI